MRSSTLTDIQGMYQFMTRTFPGNWQYRFSETPYMKRADDLGHRESIAGHVWGCIGIWLQMRTICPSLASLVDTVEMYELLWIHDLGETITGDVSSVQQLQGKGMDKHIVEHEQIRLLTDCLPQEIQDTFLSIFDQFEVDISSMTKLEYLVAKVIDIIEGNHFVLSFGENLAEHSDLICRVLDKKLTPRVQRLLEVLKENNHFEAMKEVRLLAESHIAEFNKAGVPFVMKEKYYGN